MESEIRFLLTLTDTSKLDELLAVLSRFDSVRVERIVPLDLPVAPKPAEDKGYK